MAEDIALEMGNNDNNAGANTRHKSVYGVSRRDLYKGDTIRGDEAQVIKQDKEVEAGKKFIDYFGRLIPFLYGLFAVGILGMYVTGFAAVEFKDIMLWSILGTSLISSVLGAWAVYKYGVIQDQINRLKEENEKYESMQFMLDSLRICAQSKCIQMKFTN